MNVPTGGQEIDLFVLGLITEDEFSLWEIAGYVSGEFSLARRDAQAQAREALRRLVTQGQATIYEATSDDGRSIRREVPSSSLDAAAAWALGPSGLLAFATSLGTETYFGTGSTA